MFGGSCAQQKVLSNAYSLQTIKDKYDTGSEVPYGRNFNFTEQNNGWQTGIRVFGQDMFISNRGNNNSFDSDSVFLHKLKIVNSNGTYDQRLTISSGNANFTSIDGFDLANGTNLLICGFHSNSIKSATLATPYDLSSTFTITGTKTITTGMRGCSWGNGGNKYFVVYHDQLRQFTTSTPYEVASGDTEGTSKTLSLTAASDISFSDDGLTVWISEHDGNLHQFTLSSAWDTTTIGSQITVDTATFYGNEGSSPARSSSATGTTQWICGMYWNDDGTKLYVNSLWGMTDTSEVVGSPAPTNVIGEGGSRTNTFAVIEYSVG
jgi:hypothetical protein